MFYYTQIICKPEGKDLNMRDLSIKKDIQDVKDMLNCKYIKDDYFDNTDDKILLNMLSKIVDLISGIASKLL